mgnify:CR=1 FL=1
MKFQIVYDKPGRIRFRCGAYAFDKELETAVQKQLLESAAVKRCILDRIQMIENDERRQILIKRYLDNKTVVTISKEMFMTYQGIYYHLEIGEKEIEKLI